MLSREFAIKGPRVFFLSVYLLTLRHQWLELCEFSLNYVNPLCGPKGYLMKNNMNLVLQDFIL